MLRDSSSKVGYQLKLSYLCDNSVVWWIFSNFWVFDGGSWRSLILTCDSHVSEFPMRDTVADVEFWEFDSKEN